MTLQSKTNGLCTTCNLPSIGKAAMTLLLKRTLNFKSFSRISCKCAVASKWRSIYAEAITESDRLTEVSQHDGICHIILNNVKKRNSLSVAMLEELKRNFDSIANNDDAKVVILSAKGPVFSAGHNLKELRAEHGAESHVEIFKKCSEVMCLVQDIGVPVIAQVRGLATAAGCQLVASCDMAIASENAKFATPGVSVGLFCSTPAVAIARSIPRKIAMQMLLTAQPISADDALRYGLVSKVVPDDDLEEETISVAKRIASFSKPVIAIGKKCFYEQVAKPRDEAYRIAEKVMVENLKHEDAQEGINAFVEKRKPNWSKNESS